MASCDARDKHIALGVDPHIRRDVEAADTALSVSVSPELRASRGVTFHGEEVVVKVPVVSVGIATSGNVDPADTIEKQPTGTVILTQGVVKLPEQLPVAPSHFNRAVFVDEIDPNPSHIDVARGIDFHVGREIAPAYSRLLPKG